MTFVFPDRPAELAESQLIDAILENTFPANSFLPPERELAGQLGVTRPTLREALQRMARDGWVEIHHGKPTRVRDYWQEGNLAILGAIARRQKNVSPDFIDDLLQIRTLLAPTYFALALQKSPEPVLELLQKMQAIADDAQEFTQWDWLLHYRMTIFSDNPVFTLIFNGFSDLYKALGLKYFTYPESRNHSRKFYSHLLDLATRQDRAAFEAETRQTMKESNAIWLSIS